jgi:hypothetical protein
MRDGQQCLSENSFLKPPHSHTAEKKERNSQKREESQIIFRIPCVWNLGFALDEPVRKKECKGIKTRKILQNNQ